MACEVKMGLLEKITLTCNVDEDDIIEFTNFASNECSIWRIYKGITRGDSIVINKDDARKFAEALLQWANS